MAENETIKISNAKDLYSILPEELRSEFSIGMHEFIKSDGGGRPEELFGDWDEKRIQDVKESILANGLKFSKYSRLLSTVSFSNDLSSYISGNVTKYGGIIVALPKVLKSETGEKMFIGSPNERSAFNPNWYRREEATSVCDFILPEEGLLNPMFIVGTYSVTDEGIVFTPNPNHIAYNNAIVPDQFFKEALGRFERGVENSIPKEWDAIMQETLAQQQMYDKYIGKVDSSMRVENRLDLAYMKNLKDYTDIVRDEIKTQIEDMRYLEMSDSEIKENIIEYLGIAETERLGSFYNEIQSMIEQELAVNSLQPKTSKREISQETMERLRVAIQDAKRQGLDGETIKKYIYKNQAVRGINSEDRKKWIEISSKHGIDEIMWNDYYGDSSYRGHSPEMYDAIDMLTEEEIVALTELGEKSYKHFGSRIAEKLKETVNELKSKFFSKDNGKDDKTNGR